MSAHPRLVLPAAVCLIFLSFGAAWAQQYTILDLGTLGGHASGSAAITELGQTVGWSIADPYAYYGFISAPAGPPLTSLGPPPNGDYSYALGANELGQVVGYGEVRVGFGEDDHAVLWSAGQMTDLGTLGGDASQALDINNQGQAVGWAEDTGPGSYAVLWQNGETVLLPGFEAAYPSSEAHAITDAGIAVGFSWDAGSVRQAVVWQDGEIARTLTQPPGATGATASAVNELGEVAGHAWTQGGATTALIWNALGQVSTLPPTRGHYYNVATGMNDPGVVVGASYSSYTGDPVLWQGGAAFNLEDLTQPDPAFFGFTVHGINNAGQIAATASASGGFRAVRLDPVPGSIGLAGPEPANAGHEGTLALRGATPGAKVYFVYGLVPGETWVPGCGDVTLDLGNARIVASVVADDEGLAVLTQLVPVEADGRTLYFQAVEPATCRVSNLSERRF